MQPFNYVIKSGFAEMDGKAADKIIREWPILIKQLQARELAAKKEASAWRDPHQFSLGIP